MSKIVAVLVWAVAIGTVLIFAGQSLMFGQTLWWFPEGVSDHAAAIDAQFNRTMVVVALTFILSQLALGYIVWRFTSNKSGRATYSHGSNKLEATWTIATAVIFVSLGILGQQMWVKLHINEAPPDAIKIHLLTQQFQFNFHYPGSDGVFGKTDPKFISDSSLNYVGLDPADESGKDDVQTTTLAIPKNHPVEITMRSKDVIHNFFVPALRFKQDAVPGLSVKVHFTANKVGKYEIPCAELCGSLHYNMKSFLLVLPEDEYQQLVALKEDQFKEKIAELLQNPPTER